MSPFASVARLLGALLLAAVVLPAQAPRPAPAATAPILNWRVPAFTPDGRREWLVAGTEATQVDRGRVAVREISVTAYAPDAANRAETILLSTDALVELERKLVTGTGAVRVINDRFEASGTGWTYSHGEKRVVLGKNVRVTIQAELGSLLR